MFDLSSMSKSFLKGFTSLLEYFVSESTGREETQSFLWELLLAAK